MTHLMIADPDTAFRKAMVLLLSRKLGIERLSEAADIGALVQALEENPPDILLLNWSLYGIPGLETCQLLRKSYPALKIVLLSVNADNAAVARSVGAEFLQKGLPAEQTLELIQRLVDCC